MVTLILMACLIPRPIAVPIQNPGIDAASLGSVIGGVGAIAVSASSKTEE